MNTLIFSCFYQQYNGSRPQMLLDYFSSRGEAKLIAADFCHDIKQYKTEDDERIKYIHVPDYNGNISVKRIWSHIVFAIKSVRYLDHVSADLCYICIPPNFAAYYLVKNAKKKGIPVVSDVVDVWPQKNSNNKLVNAFYKKWGSYRDDALGMADWVICECEYYRKKIVFRGNNISTIHLAKKAYGTGVRKLSDDIIRICYLGNIGNSYDFESLVYICKNLNKQCEVIIIGDGEKKQYLLDLLNRNSIKYTFYGYVYDENRKVEILKKCTFGYNAFNDDIPVALSYKSLDYLMNGLPIINSTKQDLHELINRNNAGLNFDRSRLKELVIRINNLTFAELNMMRENAIKLFREKFTEEAFETSLDKVCNTLLKRDN